MNDLCLAAPLSFSQRDSLGGGEGLGGEVNLISIAASRGFIIYDLYKNFDKD